MILYGIAWRGYGEILSGLKLKFALVYIKFVHLVFSSTTSLPISDFKILETTTMLLISYHAHAHINPSCIPLTPCISSKVLPSVVLGHDTLSTTKSASGANRRNDWAKSSTAAAPKMLGSWVFAMFTPTGRPDAASHLKNITFCHFWNLWLSWLSRFAKIIVWNPLSGCSDFLGVWCLTPSEERWNTMACVALNGISLVQLFCVAWDGTIETVLDLRPWHIIHYFLKQPYT